MRRKNIKKAVVNFICYAAMSLVLALAGIVFLLDPLHTEKPAPKPSAYVTELNI